MIILKIMNLVQLIQDIFAKPLKRTAIEEDDLIMKRENGSLLLEKNGRYYVIRSHRIPEINEIVMLKYIGRKIRNPEGFRPYREIFPSSL